MCVLYVRKILSCANVRYWRYVVLCATIRPIRNIECFEVWHSADVTEKCYSVYRFILHFYDLGDWFLLSNKETIKKNSQIFVP